MTKSIWFLWLAVVTAFLLNACASVPKEVVTLSATVERDLEEVHRAHRDLAVKYFNRIRIDIDVFVKDVYKPFTIKNTIKQFRLLEKIEASQRPNARFDTLTVLDVYVTKVSDDIVDFRKELMQPIQKQEVQVLTSIDMAYQNLQTAQKTITEHLASVREVSETRAELLNKAGLGGLQESIIDQTAALSDRIANLVDKGRAAEARIDDVQKVINELRKAVKVES